MNGTSQIKIKFNLIKFILHNQPAINKTNIITYQRIKNNKINIK